jgi:hypothetical protein
LQTTPAKIDPNVEGGIAVRATGAAPIEKARAASSIARLRKKNDRIVLSAVSEDRRAAAIASAKIDIISIIDHVRRLLRNRCRRSR